MAFTYSSTTLDSLKQNLFYWSFYPSVLALFFFFKLRKARKTIITSILQKRKYLREVAKLVMGRHGMSPSLFAPKVLIVDTTPFYFNVTVSHSKKVHRPKRISVC